jgi:hypothetical protein
MGGTTRTAAHNRLRDPTSGTRTAFPARLDAAPGHRFDKDEVAQLTRLLELVMNNAWDADVLCSRDGNARRLRAKISHDEWYQLLGFVTA